MTQSVWVEWTDTGNEIQNLGPATGKAHSPSTVLLLGITKERQLHDLVGYP